MQRPRLGHPGMPLLVLLLSGGCGVELKNAPPASPSICCFGDSLVQGAGAGSPDQTYPAQLAEFIGREVVALGRSGDTSAQALARCEALSRREFGLVVVTVGGNDLLQRIPWPTTEANLRALFQRLRATGAVVAVTGVSGPLLLSRDGLYQELCEEEGVLYIPEILAGILGNPDLTADEIHPNAAGYRLMAERVVEALNEASLLGVAE